MNAIALLALAAALLPGTINRHPTQGCNRVIPMLALDQPVVLAGQFRTTDGDCVVWFNLRDNFWPSRLCQTVSHEVRHLGGLGHPLPLDPACRRWEPGSAASAVTVQADG